jgi:16S rRNA (guanine(966)-N(2))-methyltransferase RsmD
LRIISGKYKGRKLTAVKGLKVRPTSDKLKAAIFNVLFSISGNINMENSFVLDIFAGTGALGIEAISRNARICYFIDSDADAVNVIKKNLSSIGIEDKAVVILKNYVNALKLLSEKKVKFDLILMDPPYIKGFNAQAIENINDCDIFSDKCVIVAEHGIKEILPEQVKSFYKITEKTYGDKVLSFYSTKYLN